MSKREQQAGIGLGVVGDGKGWSGGATRSDGRANRSTKLNAKRPQIYFDIACESKATGIVDEGEEVVRKSLGQIVIELFGDIVPYTAENFRQLANGEVKHVKTSCRGYRYYKGTRIHRIVPGFMLQGGDLDHLKGRGGESIYGQNFDDENFALKHDKPGMVSMANQGENTNGSQFFITTREAPHLDGKHVVFGEVIEGMDVVLKIESYGQQDGVPQEKIIIEDCGERMTVSKQLRERGKWAIPLPAEWKKRQSSSKPDVTFYAHSSGKTTFNLSSP